MERRMKDSGIEWIGNIPAEWSVCHFRNILSIFNGNSIKDEEKINYEDPVDAVPYIATKDIDVTFQSIAYDNGMYVKNTDDEFKRAPENSILLCIEGGSAGRKIAFTDREVCFINKLCCFTSKTAYNRFVYYYMLSPAFTEEFKSHISGLIGGVSISEIKDFTIAFPTYEEQKKIADYLDRKCGEIDAVIAKTKSTIEEYRKLKQVVITDAVTQGIRGIRELKTTPVETIGSIPSEWNFVRKLSYRCSSGISYGIVKLLEPDDENGVKVLRCSDVYPGGISLDNVRTVTQEVSNEYKRTLLNGGEIVIAVRGSLGGCAVVPPELAGYNVAREIAVIPLMDTICSRYVLYYLLSDKFIDYRDSHLLGSVYVGLNIELLSACPIIEPPLEEQEEIADYLDKKCAEIDTLIEKKTALLAEMESYKKSVIYEYVTGKKEVIQ